MLIWSIGILSYVCSFHEACICKITTRYKHVAYFTPHLTFIQPLYFMCQFYKITHDYFTLLSLSFIIFIFYKKINRYGHVILLLYGIKYNILVYSFFLYILYYYFYNFPVSLILILDSKTICYPSLANLLPTIISGDSEWINWSSPLKPLANFIVLSVFLKFQASELQNFTNEVSYAASDQYWNWNSKPWIMILCDGFPGLFLPHFRNKKGHRSTCKLQEHLRSI